MEVNCNMLMVDKQNRVCIVKEICDGCKHSKEECALYYLYESAGLISEWEKFPASIFRERNKSTATQKGE